MLAKSNIKKIIIVALSGGVDSAVAAARLLKQGYDVVGVYFWFFGTNNKAGKDAKKIADKLGIPLKIVDARKEFKKKVIGYFADSYKKGITPNPCVVCNKEMKFDLLLKLLKKEKADFVATGHYARLGREIPNPKSQIPNKLQITNYKLLAARGIAKDQSYFLYRLNQKDLEKIIFPLGDWKKNEVKKLAEKMKLPVAKSESQDVCFLPESGINAFLKKYLKPKPGNIVGENDNILGKHKGLPFYTIGQRKGIEIGGSGPHFVLAKNARKNELIVTKDQKKLLTRKFFVNKANWMHPGTKFPLKAQVQIRYHAPKVSAIIKPSNKPGKLAVETKKPLRAVTPGQSAVFYMKNEVLGGGIIIN